MAEGGPDTWTIWSAYAHEITQMNVEHLNTRFSFKEKRTLILSNSLQ